MLQQSSLKVLHEYNHLKQLDCLAVNLRKPTIANLRNECAVVYLKRPEEKIRTILQELGKPEFEISEAKDILTIDAEKFKPLQKYMQGNITKPNLRTIELLAWLIDFNEEQVKNETVFKSTKDVQYPWKIIGISAIVIACFSGLYFKFFYKQCMQWNGQQYVAVHCGNEGKVGEIIALKTNKIEEFHRILKPDTITYNSIGKVWYMKMNKKLEFYTDSGSLPADRRKELKPITKYIIDKYILKTQD
ncbi:hypothetical protein [Pedobacter sp.]